MYAIFISFMTINKCGILVINYQSYVWYNISKPLVCISTLLHMSHSHTLMHTFGGAGQMR